MTRPSLRMTVAAIVGALTLSLIPASVQADPTPDAEPCTMATLADLNRQVIDLNSRITAHNSQTVDRTNAGAVAAYNARADALEQQRAALAQRVANCEKSLDNQDPTGTPTTSKPASAPTASKPAGPTTGQAEPDVPTIDGGNTSRGSAPLFVWVAMGTGTFADENGNVSPQQAYDSAQSFGIPAEVLEPNTFAPYGGRTVADMLEQYVDPDTGQWRWPTNHGFDDNPVPRLRFTSDDAFDGFLDTDPGSGMFAAGTPYSDRGLPPGTIGPYVKVVGTGKPLPPNYRALSGRAVAAFGMPGNGSKTLVINTDTGRIVPIAQLIAEGYLRKV